MEIIFVYQGHFIPCKKKQKKKKETLRTLFLDWRRTDKKKIVGLRFLSCMNRVQRVETLSKMTKRQKRDRCFLTALPSQWKFYYTTLIELHDCCLRIGARQFFLLSTCLPLDPVQVLIPLQVCCVDTRKRSGQQGVVDGIIIWVYRMS